MFLLWLFGFPVVLYGTASVELSIKMIVEHMFLISFLFIVATAIYIIVIYSFMVITSFCSDADDELIDEYEIQNKKLWPSTL